MTNMIISDRLKIAAHQQVKERNYWRKKLSGNLQNHHFPYDYKRAAGGQTHRWELAKIKFRLGAECAAQLEKLSKNSDIRLHMIMVAGVVSLLHKYTGSNDIIVGTPIYKQEAEGEYINTVLPLRSRFDDNVTFKELLNAVRQTVIEASENQDYPMAVLLEELDMPLQGEDFPWFDIQIMVENIHDKTYIRHIRPNISFSFKRSEGVEGIVAYQPLRYRQTSIERIINHLKALLGAALPHLDLPLSQIDILSEEEKTQLLGDLNDTATEYPADKTIVELFAREMEKTPDQTAVAEYLDLTAVYDELTPGSETDTGNYHLLEKCCFKRNPYVFQFEDNAFLKALNLFTRTEIDRLVLLRTHRDNYVAVNGAAYLLWKALQGKANLKSVFRALENTKNEFWVYSVVIELGSTGRVYADRKTIVVNDRFDNLVLLIQRLYSTNLIELADYHRQETPFTIPPPGVPEAVAPAVDKPAPPPPAKGAVLLLGDRTGTATTGLLYIASFLRRNGINAYCRWNDTDKALPLLKANIRHLLETLKPAVVGISMKWFPHIARVLEICKIIKHEAPSVKVVLGGNTASYYKEKIIPYQWVDYVVLGDGEVPFLKICKGEEHIPNCLYKKDGKIVETPITYVQDETNSSDIYLSHLDEIFVSPLDPYLTPSFYINTGKGCTQQCFYCAGSREAQKKVFNRIKPFIRGIDEVRSDLMEARKYTSRFMFDFDLPLYDSLDYYEKIWEGIDLSNHFCRFYFWMLPSGEFIDLVVKTFKYVYLNIDLCSLSERHRLELSSLKVVKPQPTDEQLFEFFDKCERYDNVDVIINHINGLPYFSSQDIEISREILSKLIKKYSCLKEMDWGRLHAQPGAPIIETCEKYGMHSYGKTYEDFLYYSELNLKEELYPDLLTFNYPYIYSNDDTLNSQVTQYYVDATKWIEDHIEKRRRNLSVTFHTTYRELDKKSSQLAAVLKERGAASGAVVGLWAERSLEIIIGLLGILKAGAAYLPLDSRFPPERIGYMLKDSNAALLLTDEDKSTALDFNREILDITDESLYTGDPPPAENTVTPAHLAYVIYTSGSTGEPKGVMVEHGNVVRLVKNTNFIDFRPMDKLLLTGAIVFDITTFEIWGPLLNGATLFLADQELLLDGEKIGEILNENNISILHLIPQLFNRMAHHYPEIFAGLNYLMVGGDLVNPHYVNKIKHLYPELKILHMYGPTENTTFSTFLQVDKEYEDTIPIGKPVSNSSIFIINKQNQPVPFGIPGELAVGGDGVSRGYQNNPELTAEKFVYIRDSSRWYRTGDLARWLADGNMEFLGRIDNQVKIRGIRIELREIESRLLNHQKVKEAVVINREKDMEKTDDSTGEKYLCAYIVPQHEGAFKDDYSMVEELRASLSQKLPDYMLPSHFVAVDSIPLTHNGKIDRKALPAPGKKTTAVFIAPRNRTEEKLTEIWSEVLDISHTPIGIDDNFFHLGGHSLNATVMTSRIHKELEVRLNLTDVFEAQTVRALAEMIDGMTRHKFQSIGTVEKKEYYPLTSAQKRLYILQQLDVTATGYNIPLIMEAEGEFSERNLEETFRQLIARHESFRTSFEEIGEPPEPVQRIHPEVTFHMERCGPGETVIDQFLRPFDLSRAPLLRAGLLKIDKGKHLLMVDMHHIISDGSSHNILAADFRQLYGGRKLPKLRIQYKDYAEWRKNSVTDLLKKQEVYWLEQFKKNTVALNLPTDFARPEIQTFEGSYQSFEINREETRALMKITLDAEATLFMTLLAVTNVFLEKISGQDDIVIGIPVSGHHHPDMEKIIGMFVNTLPLRNFPSPGKGFAHFLEEVKENTLHAFENQDYQFEDLVDAVVKTRDISRNPLYDVSFNFANFNEPVETTGHSKKDRSMLNLKPYDHPFNISKYDLELHVVREGEKLLLALIYSTKLFKIEKIRLFIKYFKNIVSSIIENPGKSISEIEIEERVESDLLLTHFSENLEEE